MSYTHSIEVEIVDPYQGDERLSPAILLKLLNVAQNAIAEYMPEVEIRDMSIRTMQYDDTTPVQRVSTIGIVDVEPGS